MNRGHTPRAAHVARSTPTASRTSIVVVETEDYRAVMRRWYKGSTKLMLSADSFEDYEDMIFGMDDGPVRVIGTVVWFQAANEME